MEIRYRNYTFQTAGAVFTVRRGIAFNEAYQRQTRTVQVELMGKLIVASNVSEADAPAALKALTTRIEEAFSVDGGDLTVTHPNGVVALSLKSANYIGGLRVTLEPSYLETGPGELIRQRSFEINVEGLQDVLAGAEIGGGNLGNLSFEETFSYEGTGGPRFVVIETMEGPPVEQQVNARTMCRCVQSGRARKRGSYPPPSPPLYPAKEQFSQRAIERSSSLIPDRETSWRYVFESAVPFA